MSEHLSAEQIERYQRRAMSPPERLAIDGHLTACDVCRGRLRDGEQIASAWASLQADLERASAEPHHVSYEDLAAYVDNTLGEVEREIVASHLEICLSCAAEAGDLLRVADAVKTDPVKPYAPASLRERLRAFPRWPVQWMPQPWVATASAAVLMVAVAGLLIWKSMPSGSLRKEERASSASTAPPPAVVTAPQERPAAPATYPPQPVPPVTPELPLTTVLSLNMGGGRQLTLDSRGQITGVEAYPAALRKLIQTTVGTRRITTPPVLLGLIGRRRTSRSGADTEAPFDLRGPSGTLVPADTPTFRWQPLSGATGYTVRILDARLREVERSPLRSATEWTPTRPLARGGIYTWQVTAIKHGEEYTAATASGRRAKFKVLEQAKTDELLSARARYADAPLILGILFAEAGLLDDAQQQLEVLVDANRNGSPDARALTEKLLSDLQALRSVP